MTDSTTPSVMALAMFTPEQHVQSMGGEILKQDGRVFVRLSGSVKIGSTEIPYQLVPANGVLAKSSKWRNMTPENQLLLVTQRVNAKAVRALNAQVHDFVIRIHEIALDYEIDSRPLWKGLLESSMPVDEQFAAIEQRVKHTIEKAEEVRQAEATRTSINLAEYPESFEVAYKMRRKFIALLGKTNSGKSHSARLALVAAKSGVYLAPLRLLALENHERLVAEGVKSSLITGEQRIIQEGAQHISSTVEMLDTRTQVEVAVIDEIQMLGDRERGAAWTAAVCGVPADTVYLVGALEARPAIEALAKRLGCPLEVQIMQRKAPLSVQSTAVKKIRNLKRGDAVIAFSRRDVLLWRDLITEAGLSCATVYGNLSPEVRRAQAERFLNKSVDIVVGTDSIGYGLNLPIERVVFTTSTKFNGIEDEELPAALAQQIAGRAGRYGVTDAGYVAGFDDETHRVIQSLLKEKVADVPSRGFSVAPSIEQLQRIAGATKEQSLAKLLNLFVRKIDVLDGFFVPRVTEDQLERAAWLDTLPLSLGDKFILSLVPISTRSSVLETAWQQWAKSMAKKQPFVLQRVSMGFSRERLQDVEDSCKLYSAYAWLAYRCPQYFPSIEQAQRFALEASAQVDQILQAQNKGFQRRPKSSGEQKSNQAPARRDNQDRRHSGKQQGDKRRRTRA